MEVSIIFLPSHVPSHRQIFERTNFFTCTTHLHETGRILFLFASVGNRVSIGVVFFLSKAPNKAPGFYRGNCAKT